jgi:hypothetical protein
MGFGFGPPLVSRGNGAFRPPPPHGPRERVLPRKWAPHTQTGNGFCHRNGKWVLDPLISSSYHLTGMDSGFPARNWFRVPISKCKTGVGFPAQNGFWVRPAQNGLWARPRRTPYYSNPSPAPVRCCCYYLLLATCYRPAGPDTCCCYL